MDKKWENDVRNMFAKLKNNRDIVECIVNGLKIKVFPDVFSPGIFFESGWYAEKLAQMVRQKSLLEIGTGTGIIALVSALQGAQVTAIDINEQAVRNAELNFKEHNVDAVLHTGSVYEPLSNVDKFDFIFWNHPFNKSDQDESDVFLKSVFDYQYKDLENYVSNAREYLAAEGRLLLGTSNIAKIEDLEEIAHKYGHHLVLLEKIDRPTEVNGKDIDFRIYEFVKRV